MITDLRKKIAKSACLFRTFFALSLLVVCVYPTNCFAKDSRSSSSASSKASIPETDKTEAPEGDVEESQARDASENRNVRAENYKRARDDAMVAAPAFGE